MLQRKRMAICKFITISCIKVELSRCNCRPDASMVAQKFYAFSAKSIITSSFISIDVGLECMFSSCIFIIISSVFPNNIIRMDVIRGTLLGWNSIKLLRPCWSLIRVSSQENPHNIVILSYFAKKRGHTHRFPINTCRLCFV